MTLLKLLKLSIFNNHNCRTLYYKNFLRSFQSDRPPQGLYSIIIAVIFLTFDCLRCCYFFIYRKKIRRDSTSDATQHNTSPFYTALCFFFHHNFIDTIRDDFVLQCGVRDSARSCTGIIHSRIVSWSWFAFSYLHNGRTHPTLVLGNKLYWKQLLHCVVKKSSRQLTTSAVTSTLHRMSRRRWRARGNGHRIL